MNRATEPSLQASAQSPRSEMLEVFRNGLLAAAAVLTLFIPPALVTGRIGTPPVALSGPTLEEQYRGDPGPRFADFGAQKPSPDARHLADWVADTRDNQGAGFFIVDKQLAMVHVFNADARLQASSPVLLGAARGDDSVPGIGTRPLDQVMPHERTTPAGRFVAERGRNATGEDVVWVDYDAAVSMHRVRNSHPLERRLQRLATASIADNRISYGCINVPVAFFESHIQPAFANRRAVVYVLPETSSAQQVFGSYDVASAHRERFARGSGAVAAGALAVATAAPACTWPGCAGFTASR